MSRPERQFWGGCLLGLAVVTVVATVLTAAGAVIGGLIR